MTTALVMVISLLVSFSLVHHNLTVHMFEGWDDVSPVFHTLCFHIWKLVTSECNDTSTVTIVTCAGWLHLHTARGDLVLSFFSLFNWKRIKPVQVIIKKKKSEEVQGPTMSRADRWTSHDRAQGWMTLWGVHHRLKIDVDDVAFWKRQNDHLHRQSLLKWCEIFQRTASSFSGVCGSRVDEDRLSAAYTSEVTYV